MFKFLGYLTLPVEDKVTSHTADQPQKKRQKEVRGKRLINSVLVISMCWRRNEKRLERRANAAVKIQSEKTGGSSERTPDKFSDTYPEVLETSPKKEGKCSCENSCGEDGKLTEISRGF
ncbi:unnamed protein product [Porites lobata]|uniref:Uncharacterized protein n=1 Tax=Porites lobata TaxID=104759 RepID=A0ABN8QFJ1_9CNID|nr:unnamed protein product [Porites lobata]